MDKLGINPTLILFQVANFFVLMFLLKKFLYKPVLKMLDKRREAIEHAENLKHELDAQKKAIEMEREQVIAGAKEEANTLFTETQKQTEEIKRNAQEEARKQAEHITERAAKQASEQEEQLRHMLEEKAQKTAVSIAENVLRTTITEEQRAQILAETAKEFAHK